MSIASESAQAAKDSVMKNKNITNLKFVIYSVSPSFHYKDTDQSATGVKATLEDLGFSVQTITKGSTYIDVILGSPISFEDIQTIYTTVAPKHILGLEDFS